MVIAYHLRDIDEEFEEIFTADKLACFTSWKKNIGFHKKIIYKSMWHVLPLTK